MYYVANLILPGLVHGTADRRRVQPGVMLGQLRLLLLLLLLLLLVVVFSLVLLLEQDLENPGLD